MSDDRKNEEGGSVGMERQRNEPKQGQPLTAESVGLLKAGDVLRCDRWAGDSFTAVQNYRVIRQGNFGGPVIEKDDGEEYELSLWSEFTFVERPTPLPIEDAERASGCDCVRCQALTDATEQVSDVEVLRGEIDAITDSVLPAACDVTGLGEKSRAMMQVEIANKLLALIARSQPKGAGQSSGEALPCEGYEALSTGFATTESEGHANPSKRKAFIKIAFDGNGAAERADLAMRYLDGLVKRDRAPTDNADGLSADREAVALTVWYGKMPESNGRENWTATLRRVNPTDKWDQGFCFARSEYPGRVLYEADRMRWIIGERSGRPDILAYDADAHSGYVERPAPAGQDLAAALMSAQSFIADGGHAETEPGSSVYRQVTQALAALKDRA